MATGMSDLSERVETAANEDETATAETSLTRRARFSDQPVERSGWIELGQSEMQVVTLTGTITRGQNPGQQVEVQLEMREDELTRLNDNSADTDSDCLFGANRGPHILLVSFLFIPFSFISSLCLSFYLGTHTWYNAIVFFSEERTVWHKVFLCPLLILTFPFTIGLSALTVALYSAVVQISWFARNWCRKIRDFEKGFYGWFCDIIGLPQCAPYNIVVLNESGEIETH